VKWSNIHAKAVSTTKPVAYQREPNPVRDGRPRGRQKMATEKRLIDANAIGNGIGVYVATNAYLNDTALDALGKVAKWLDEAPTVDAVEVVRCKNCKHCKKYRNRLDPMRNHQLCVRMDKYAFGVEEDDFCSYGERRTDNG